MADKQEEPAQELESSAPDTDNDTGVSAINPNVVEGEETETSSDEGEGSNVFESKSTDQENKSSVSTIPTDDSKLNKSLTNTSSRNFRSAFSKERVFKCNFKAVNLFIFFCPIFTLRICKLYHPTNVTSI